MSSEISCNPDSSSKRSENLSHPKDDAQNMPDRFFLHRQGYLMTERTVLGEGTYSKVRKAYSKKMRKDVAIKIVSRNHAPNDFLTRFFPRELQIIKEVNHKNICKYYDILDTGNKVYMIMEYASNKDLLEYVQANQYVHEKEARHFLLQITDAIEYLHSLNVFHRDIKCENILLTENKDALLTDFSFSKQVNDIGDLNRTYCGSSAYAPIEILKGIPYDGPKAEIWSLGCVLFVMATGTMPFDDSNKTNQVKQMKLGVTFLRSKKKLSIEVMSLIRKMLHINPNERLTLAQVKSSEWCIERCNNRALN